MAKHAKRKKSKSSKTKTVHRRRGRMSGAMSLNANSDLVKFGSIALGFLALHKPVNEAIDKVADPTKVDQKLVAGAQVGLGAGYIFLMKGKKNLLLTLASGVLAGAGVKRGMAAFGLGSIAINGYQSVPSVNGYQNVPAVNGTLPKRIGAYTPGAGGMGMNNNKIAIGNAGLLRSRMRA